MTRQIYAVLDLVAQDIVGGLMLFPHDAPVIRIFTDGLADPSTTLNKHPDDFALVCLGEVVAEGSDIELSGYNRYRTVLTGTAWKSMQAAQAKPEVELVK